LLPLAELRMAFPAQDPGLNHFFKVSFAM
jgi:hypothetical protein